MTDTAVQVGSFRRGHRTQKSKYSLSILCPHVETGLLVTPHPHVLLATMTSNLPYSICCAAQVHALVEHCCKYMSYSFDSVELLCRYDTRSPEVHFYTGTHLFFVQADLARDTVSGTVYALARRLRSISGYVYSTFLINLMPTW